MSKEVKTIGIAIAIPCGLPPQCEKLIESLIKDRSDGDGVTESEEKAMRSFALKIARLAMDDMAEHLSACVSEFFTDPTGRKGLGEALAADDAKFEVVLLNHHELAEVTKDDPDSPLAALARVAEAQRALDDEDLH